jgi:glycosyltransferase involved in cell wall biosynthesis
MPPRLAVLPDFPAEGWPSMDLCGEMLLAHLPTAGPLAVEPHRVCPPFVRLATRLPLVGTKNAAFNADRLLNRFVTFPQHARRVAPAFDLFHVVDHTYAQLVHALPADRTGVYCHDLDAFRCILDPARDRRPGWFRRLARRILTGLQMAAVVLHSTQAVGDELKRLGLIDPAKLVHAPYGVSAEFTPHPTSPAEPMPWLNDLTGRPWVLHVGSCIPRKRIDVLLDVLAELRRTLPEVKLVKVGGEWSAEHREQMSRLNLQPAVVHVTGLSREQLAEVYRRAPVVLVPSEAEGFGLPVIEALACGSAVVASDLPVLREVGGEVTTYCAVGDVPAWVAAVQHCGLLAPRAGMADRSPSEQNASRLAWASRYRWAAHADTIAAAYHRILKGEPPCGSCS